MGLQHPRTEVFVMFTPSMRSGLWEVWSSCLLGGDQTLVSWIPIRQSGLYSGSALRDRRWDWVLGPQGLDLEYILIFFWFVLHSGLIL